MGSEAASTRVALITAATGGLGQELVRQFAAQGWQVALGYHFCFGTLGGWPRFQPDDLGQAVELANGFVKASGRKVDWIHIPVLDRSDDGFFAPLENLNPQGARVYLGMIHNMGSFRSRLQTARKYLPEFGLGAYCGFGRLPVSELPQVLADHL